MSIEQTKNGFTLIELLLYLGISATILFVVSTFFVLMLQSKVKNQTIAEVEQQGMAAMQIITQTIRNATSISLPYPGTSAPNAVFVVPEQSQSPAAFDMFSGRIRVTEGSGQAVDLTNSHVAVSSLDFQNLSWPGTAGDIRVSFTLTKNNPENRNEYSYSRTFYATASLRK